MFVWKMIVNIFFLLGKVGIGFGKSIDGEGI